MAIALFFALTPGEFAAQTTNTVSQASPGGVIARLNIRVNQTKDFVVGLKPVSVIVVSPEIAAVQNKNEYSISFTGLKVGETMVIVTDNYKRLTFILEVEGNVVDSKRINQAAAKKESRNYSGAYGVSYTNGSGENASVLRQNFDFRRRLSKERDLRFSGEMFRFLNRNDGGGAFAGVENFGLDRISLGIDSPDGSVDFLDSRLDVSPLSFNNYTMRGFHLISAPDSRLRGAEIFAGLARQSLSLFDRDQGGLGGATIPVVRSDSFNVRAGVAAIFQPGNSKANKGGTIFQISASYAPNKFFRTEAEIAYANEGVSWRTRFDLRRQNYNAYGEIVRFDNRSPLISIGAQGGGRRTEAVAFQWRPATRLSVAASFNHTKISPSRNSALAGFDRTTFFATASYSLKQNSRLNFRFTEQTFETAVPGSESSIFELESRTASVNHNIQFKRRWSNNFEAGITFSRETNTGAEMEKGFGLSERLGFSWRGGSVAGFASYTRKTPSLASLIFRNPRLLPPLVRTAFVENPAQFLQANPNLLAALLPGVELPLTRSFDAGFRAQTKISRFDLTGETRYAAGEIFAVNRRNIFASVGASIRLDSANSLQISGWRYFGLNGQTNQTVRSALTVSYTHRFGAGDGDGFQFAKLLGFDRGSIKGRVFYDLNGNGFDDQGEPGLAGMKVQIDEKSSAITDSNGRFSFKTPAGEHRVAVLSNDLGVRLRASTATEQNVVVTGGGTANVSFGLSDFGSIGGRVFNDLSSNGSLPNGSGSGVAGVKLILRSSEKSLVSQPTDASGNYEFRNLRPGNYTLEIDAQTLPPNFRLPEKALRSVTVEPLRGFYLDVPLVAQRAVSGFVFIDKDGDGQFDARKDEPVAGARIVAEGATVISDANGAYLLRNLPAGKLKIFARALSGAESLPLQIELTAEPITKREVNFIVEP